MNEKIKPLTDDQMNELTFGSLKKHQRGLKILTGTALVLWLVAIAASISIMLGYAVLYLPKEKTMVSNFEKEINIATTNAVPSVAPEKDRAREKMVLFSMTRATSIGVVATAASVTVLSAGMFATIILVIWNRRVTLRQINANLTKISAQLKAFEDASRQR